MFDRFLPPVAVEAGSGTSRPATSPAGINQNAASSAAGSGTSRPAASSAVDIQQLAQAITKSIVDGNQVRGESQSTLSDGGPSPDHKDANEGAMKGSSQAEMQDASEKDGS